MAVAFCSDGIRVERKLLRSSAGRGAARDASRVGVSLVQDTFGGALFSRRCMVGRCHGVFWLLRKICCE